MMQQRDMGTGDPALHSREVDADFIELDEEQLVSTRGTDVLFDRRAAEWLAKENVENLTVKVDLYKFDNPKTGESKALVNHWENELPDQHDLGLKYGSGRYMLLLTFPEGKRQKRGIHGFRFRLHENYDQMKREALAQQYGNPNAAMVPVAYQGPGGNGGDGSPLTAGLGAVKGVLEILAPILQQRQQPTTSPDVAALMVGMYKGMGQTFQSAARENAMFYQDMQRTMMGLPSPTQPEAEEVEQPKGIVDTIMPYLAEWIPKMLGQGPAANATAATVKNLPLFKAVVKSKTETARIVAHLDTTYGPDKTDTLLTRLGIKRPVARRPQKPRARTRRTRAAHPPTPTPTGPEVGAATAAATAAAQ